MSEGVQITKGELHRLVWTVPISTLAKRFKLSPNGLAKICDRLDIDRPPKGYWANRSSRDEGPPAGISEPDTVVEIGGKRHAARRQQTRMSLDERRSQILDVARDIVLHDGVHSVSLRGIARQIGISEAQAYNCFESRTVLLVELTMRELDAYEVQRKDIVSRGPDRATKVLLSTLHYLQAAAERGVITTQLMAVSEIRRHVQEKRHAARRAVRDRQIQQVVSDRGVSDERALIEVTLLGHLTLRAGGLVSEGRLSISQAQQLIVPPIMQTATRRETS